MYYFSDETNWQKMEKVLFSWIGTPYRHMQMAKGRGADCTLFLAAIWKEFGLLTNVEHEYYKRDWINTTKDQKVINGILKHYKEYAIDGITLKQYERDEELFRGDLLVFCLNEKGIANHAGVYLGDEKLIHATNLRGVSVYFMGQAWRSRITTFFRVEV